MLLLLFIHAFQIHIEYFLKYNVYKFDVSWLRITYIYILYSYYSVIYHYKICQIIIGKFIYYDDLIFMRIVGITVWNYIQYEMVYDNTLININTKLHNASPSTQTQISVCTHYQKQKYSQLWRNLINALIFSRESFTPLFVLLMLL